MTVQLAVAPILTPRYPSQLIQALLEGLLVFFVMIVVWWRPRKPGVVAAFFGLNYAVARIVGEQFRMPDAQIGFQALGLTRGQWLSVVMLVIAIAFLTWTLRRKAPRLGGFFPAKN
jgi:phosphatidylglycerol:prolipoprotein diacylglycerol transferase